MVEEKIRVVDGVTYVEHPIPLTPVIEFDGKTYVDITDLILSSEWKENEHEVRGN